MAIMVYALWTYHWRAASIRRGGRGPYDDRLGPVSATSHTFCRKTCLYTSYPDHVVPGSPWYVLI